MPQSFHVLAPAKVNLFLHVTGKRADGYHNLQSLMCFADTGDDLRFEEYDAFAIDVAGPFADELPDAQDNLIGKAARLLAAEYGVPLRGKITLTKNLPVAAGIGGGSADAAAALRGLARLWNLAEDLPRLQKTGLRLGADVPACIAARTAFADGVGEILTNVKHMPALHLALANPRIPVPTADIFKNFGGGFSAVLPVTEDVTVEKIVSSRNDLMMAAVALVPEIAGVLNEIEQTKNCLLARMSGSGATCFGLYADGNAAQKAAQALAERKPAWWVRAARVI